MVWDEKKIRSDFPMIEKVVYLDSAASAQKPFKVIERMAKFLKSEYANVHRAVYDLSEEATQEYNTARLTISKFLNAASLDEIVFTKNTTEGINLLAFSLGEYLTRQGDSIVVTTMEHHSNIVPWQLLAKRKGLKLKVATLDANGDLDLQFFKKIIKGAKIVSVAHAANTTATVNPIKEIAKLCHEEGALLVVDGAQGVAHLEVDVQEMDPDFYLFSGHKIYGPTGIGVLYGKGKILAELPPYQAGGDMIEEVTFENTKFQKPPLRFEAGTPPFVEAIGLKEAIDYLNDLGLKNIIAHEDMLTSYAIKKLLEIDGVKILGKPKERTALVTFHIDGAHPLDIGTLLNLKKICIRTGRLCAQPALKHFGVESACRISFGLYNTTQEIDFFISSLHEAIIKLR